MGKVCCKHPVAVTCLFLFVLLSVGAADAGHEEAELFEKAYGYYLSYQPEKAVETFDQFVSRFPSSSALDSVMFWRAKSLAQMKKFDEAARDFRLLRERYPDSSYTAFAEKELAAIELSPQKSDRHDIQKERPPKKGDAKTSVYEEKIGRLEAEITNLEKRLSESEKVRQLTEKGLVKALDDKNSLESQVENERRAREDLDRKWAAAEKCEKDRVRLIEDRKALEAKVKDQEEKLRAASAQTDGQKDRDREAAALAARLQEQEKKQKENEGTIKQLTQERHQLEAQVKEKDKQLAKAAESAAQSDQSRQKTVQELNERLKKAETDRAALEEQLGREKKRLAEAAGRGSEREISLQGEVGRLEKERKDLLGKVDTLKSERDELAKKAAEGGKATQERKQAEADAQRLRTEADALQKKVKELESAQQDRKALEAKVKDQEEKLRAASAQTDGQKDRDREAAALAAEVDSFKRPVVRIGSESYSVAQLVNESAVAANVKRKLKADPVPWTRRSPLDTFILEQALYLTARKENITAKGNDIDTLGREHKLSGEELQYLAKYLAIDNLYRRKITELASPSIDEKSYYEKNREEFVSRPGGKTVRIMVIPYTANDELEKGVLALDLLHEASKGKSLDEVARKNRSNVSFKELPVDSVKGWLREKVNLLREGELSPVISYGNEYMVMQVQKTKTQYRPYEEVRSEIQKKLARDGSEQEQRIDLWLGKIYDQVEFIR